MDSKSAFGLGPSRVGSQISNWKNEAIQFANILDNTLRPKLLSLASISQKIGGAFATNLVNQYTSSENRVSPAPPTANVSGPTTGGPTNNQVMAPPPSAGVTAAAAGYAAGRMFNQVMPSTNEYVQQDLLTNRARFYGFGARDVTSQFTDANGNVVGFKMGGSSTGISSANNNVVNLQNTLNMRGTITDKMDAARALVLAQNLGIAGAPNRNMVMEGAAVMSNLTPGMGITGGVQATAAVQQARSVNMLMGIGIKVRGADGSMKPLPDIVNEIWNKMNREKLGDRKLTEQDVLISLEPGNHLALLLDNYFGNDPVLRKSVEDGLLVKAKANGQDLNTITKKQLQDMGVSTAAVNSLSNRTARNSRILQQTAGGGAAGFTAANDIAADLAIIGNGFSFILKPLAALSQLMSGIAGIGNGLGGKLMGAGAGAAIGFGLGGPPGAIIGGLLGLAGRESGGDVDGKVPYIVGEKGPELFVPKTDGTIVPNHDLPSGIFRKDGGGVKAGGASSSDVLYSYLLSQGLSKGGAEGVIGNLTWESGLNPTIKGDSGTSYGIAQWHAGRWDNLNKFAKSRGLNPGTLDAQKQFLMYELNNKGYAKLLSQLKDPNISKYDAAAAFMRIFERPKDQSDAAALKRANAFGKAVTIPEGGGSPADPSSSTPANTSGRSIKELLKGSAQGSLTDFFKTAGIAQNTHNYGSVTINVPQTSDHMSIISMLKELFTGNSIASQIGQS